MTNKQVTNGSSQPATRALFCIATTHLMEEDRGAARELGIELYDKLTRAQNYPLAFGPGIPVAIDVEVGWDGNDHLNDLADHVLLVIVAGTDSVLLEPDEAAQRLEQLSNSGTQLTKLLVPTDERWRGEAAKLTSVKVSSAVLGKDNPASVFDSVLLAAGKCLDAIDKDKNAGGRFDSLNPPKLFVSGLRGQPGLNLGLALSIGLSGQAASLGRYFKSIGSIDDLVASKDSATNSPLGGVLLSLRGHAPGEAGLYDRELIIAKKYGWPIVFVAPDLNPSSLQLEVESSRGSTDWNSLFRQAVVAHLRQRHFHSVANQIIRACGLPVNTSVIGGAPDLLDLTIGTLSNSPTRIVLHPDPALTPENREVLRAAAPLVHAVTPSTLMGRGRRESTTGRLVSPLDGIRVGLSVSNIPASDLRLGQTDLHLQDATVQITRSLIGGGASITYGGKFLLGNEVSFTPLLAELIESYNQTAMMPAERLQVFQAAGSELTDVPANVKCRIRHLARSRNLSVPAILSAEEVGRLPGRLEYSDMRNAMTAETDARVAIGGKPFPKDDDDSSGYSGRFPGIAEEVVRALGANQPVYVCGGFGGITKRLAELMEQPGRIDDFWDDKRYGFNKVFTGLAWDVDNHPASKRLGLPRNLMELARSVAMISRDMEDDDEAWLEFNGLTLAQNRVLWNTIDPILLSSLIGQGLLRWRSRRNTMQGRYQIEAVHGNVSAVTRADVLAISVFDDVDPQGAGAAIDRVTGGMVRQAQQVPGRLIGVRSDQLDVDYLCALSLGNVTDGDGDSATVAKAVTRAARDIMSLCVNEGFDSLAVVTFGGSSLKSFPVAIEAMMKGFCSVKSSVLIKWVEADATKFDELVKVLSASGKADVTTVLKPKEANPATRYPWFNLTVKYREGVLDVTTLAPEGTGVAWTRTIDVDQQTIDALSDGHANSNETPKLAELRKRGLQLSRLVFGEYGAEFWERYHDVPLAITHDAAASKIPFELMRFEAPGLSNDTPSIGQGIHRWLAVGGGRISSSFGRPRLSRKLRIGLVIDPTGDLPGAVKEGIAIQRILQAMGDSVQFQSIGTGNAPASLANVTDMLRQVDILHYCGHAFFAEDDRAKSGLVLADGEILTSEKLEAITPIPRVMLFNACQAGRVRGRPPARKHEAYSLAEMVLRGGVEAFLGTFWEVGDAAAESFAKELYTQLSSGLTLRESVTFARRKLNQDQQNDWANYCLYGDGRFQLA